MSATLCLTARGESLAAFDERCIPASGVAPPSNTPGILSRRALPAGRLARLGATPDFHHGLPAPEPERISFNRDVRPIMSDTCFRCHGPDKNARMAGMPLDIREEAIRPPRSVSTPIVPGAPH